MKILKLAIIFLVITCCDCFGTDQNEFLEKNIKQYDKEHSFKSGSEPDGFRGIKWGAKLKSLKDMEVQKRNDPFGMMGKDVVVCIKNNESLQIGGANLATIQYFFNEYEGFYEVLITAKGYKNCVALKGVVFERFGPVKSLKPEDKDSGIDSILYNWNGDNTYMNLMMFDSETSATLFISSKKIKERMDEKKRLDVEKGAKKDF